MFAASVPAALAVRGNPDSLSNHHQQSIKCIYLYNAICRDQRTAINQNYTLTVTLTTLATFSADREFLIGCYLLPVSNPSLLLIHSVTIGLRSFTFTFPSIICIHNGVKANFHAKISRTKVTLFKNYIWMIWTHTHTQINTKPAD